MKNVLEQTLQVRKAFYHIAKSTSKQELLIIPEGYNNNIWWNIAHIVAVQQGLVYGLSGLQMQMPQELINKFKKGTFPDGTASDEEIELVKKLLFATIEQSIEDYSAGLFANYKEYTTSANVTLKNVNDAVSFNLFHEGLHLGSIFALQKAVKL